MSVEKILTVEEAAELLDLSPLTVQRYCKVGKLAAELLPVHGQQHVRHRYQIALADVMALKARRESGDAAFKPGPPRYRGDGHRTFLYVPRPAEWRSWLTGVLPAEERAIILEYFARIRQDDNSSEVYKAELSDMRELVEYYARKTGDNGNV